MTRRFLQMVSCLDVFETPAGYRPTARNSLFQKALILSLPCLSLASFQPEVRAAEENQFELRAILTVAGARHAMIASKKVQTGPYFLRVGQSKNKIEMVSVDPATGKVAFKEDGVRRELRMDLPGGAVQDSLSPRGVLWLQNATVADAVMIYQRVTTRIALRATDMDPVRFNLRAQGLDTPKATVLLSEAFHDHRIDVIPNGKQFALVKPAGAAIPAIPNYERIIQALTATSRKASEDKHLPSGSINFPGIGIDQFLEFYAELGGRTILRPFSLPSVSLTLQTQVPVNLWEAIYMMDMTLALNGVKSTFLGDKFAAVTVLEYDTSQLDQPPAPTKESKTIKAGAIKLNHADSSQAYKLYKQFTGSQVSFSPNLPSAAVALNNQTDLADNQAAYAIETTLHLHGIHLQRTDDNNVRAMPLAEAATPANDSP